MDWYAWAGQRYSATDESVYIELEIRLPQSHWL